MKQQKKQVLFFGIVLGAAILLSPTAFAADDVFFGERPGEAFRVPSEEEIPAAGTGGDLTVGTDGTVYPGTAPDDRTDPFTRVDLPVGEYPESYGIQTDMDIAANSVFPNETAPTTQTENCYRVTYEPSVASGALPVGDREGVGRIPGGVSPFGSIPNGAVGRVRIPEIGLYESVFEGETGQNMRKGIGHFSCTPIYCGNIALAGHNRGSHPAFGKLHRLHPGSRIYYETAYGVRAYRVQELRTVSVTDIRGLLQDGRESLTLYTCIANRPQVKLMVRAEAI